MQLYCGHIVPDKVYNKMYAALVVRCPRCGMEWRGSMVINRDKGQLRRDMFEAERRGREAKSRR